MAWGRDASEPPRRFRRPLSRSRAEGFGSGLLLFCRDLRGEGGAVDPVTGEEHHARNFRYARFVGVKLGLFELPLATTPMLRRASVSITLYSDQKSRIGTAQIRLSSIGSTLPPV